MLQGGIGVIRPDKGGGMIPQGDSVHTGQHGDAQERKEKEVEAGVIGRVAGTQKEATQAHTL